MIRLDQQRSLRIVQDALRLSAHVLVKNISQLAGQLGGRLRETHNPAIGRLAQQARSRAPLRPRWATLTAPGGPLIRTFEGHTESVRVVTRLDERRVASGGWDDRIIVWDIETGEAVRVFEGHEEHISAIGVLDQQRVVSSGTREILVWEIDTGRVVRTIKLGKNEGHISDIAVLDPRRFVCAQSGLLPDWSADARVFDVDTGEPIERAKRVRDAHALVRVDQRRVVIVERREIYLWEIGGEVRSLYSGLVYSAAIAGRRIIVAPWQKLVMLDPQTGQTLSSVELEGALHTALTMLDDRRLICLRSWDDKAISVRDINTWEIVKELHGHTATVNAVAVVGGSRIVSASDDHTVRLWDVELTQIPSPIEGHGGLIKSICVVDDRFIVTASHDKTLRLWDIFEGRLVKTFEGHEHSVLSVARFGDRQLVSGSGDGTIRIWDIESGAEYRRLVGDRSERISAVVVMGDGRIVAGSYSGELCVWGAETNQVLRRFEGYNYETGADGHSFGINGLAVIDQRRVVTASKDTTLRVWDIDGAGTLRVLQGRSDNQAVAKLDGYRVVSACVDGAIWLWNIDNGETLKILEGHTDIVLALAVIDEHRIVSASHDTTVRVWDVDSGRTLTTFTVDAPATSVAFHASARLIIIGDELGGLHFLELTDRD